MGMLIQRIPRPVAAISVPEGNIDISSAGGEGSWLDTGLNISLTEPGIYNLFWNIAIVLSEDAQFDNKWVNGRIVTDLDEEETQIGNACYMLAVENLAPNGDYFPRQTYVGTVVTVGEPATYKLQVYNHSISTGCAIEAAYTTYGYNGMAY